MRKSLLGCLVLVSVALWLSSPSLAGPLSGVDSDTDGVDNVIDNCTTVSNASQLDVDGDGCGNACDGDFDQTGLTSIGDFTTFKICFTRTVGAPGGPVADPSCTEADMDGTGVMSIGDFILYKNENGGTPGPSGSPIKAGPPSCP